MFQIAIVVSLINKKKLDLRGASRPPNILIRRRPSNAGRENPPEPRLFLTLGLVPFLGTVPGPGPLPTGPGNRDARPGQADYTAQAIRSTSRGFFPTGGEIRPGRGSNPPTYGVPPVASHHSG